MNDSMAAIEKNIESRNVRDRIMWFSMWFLLTIVTFGAVGSFMMYYLVKRRNGHFERTAELQKLILEQPRKVPSEKGPGLHAGSSEFPKLTVRSRNALAWAILSLLIFPTMYILYFLTKDLQEHKESEHSLFAGIILMFPNFNMNLPMDNFEISKSTWRTYLILTVLTLGFMSVYWLYRIFNDYNYHFKMQWKLEDYLLMRLRNACP